MSYIAILLTVFNRKKKTLLCLSNLYEQILPDNIYIKIYLTDDGSTDGTSEAIHEAFPKVHIIKGDGTLYWNRGMHKAWETAARERKYDYYFWLNDDTFIYKDCIKSLLDVVNSKDNKIITIGSTVDTKEHRRLTYGGRDKTGNVAQPLDDDSPVPVVMMNGNIVLVPRYVYEKLGTLDPYFTHARGDFDYGLRALKAGIELWQVGHPLGECDLHERIDAWCDPEVPLKKRWKLMYRPNGMPPMEIFHLEKRHYGFGTALKHYFTIHLRCLWPSLWIITGKAKMTNN